MSAGAADKKILADLDTLNEQVDLCLDMLKASRGKPINGRTSDEALLGVIGFLEACAPRMVELIEAATQGVLSEATLNKCLEANDRLLKVLSDFDTTQNSSTEINPPPVVVFQNKSDFDLDLDDLLLSDPPSSAASADPFGENANVATKKFTIDDVFADTESDAKKKQKPDSVDEFEDFFK
eukprot:CAMPEP_0172421966 /NCGR_PEP_ID=MMETSP1064-20121228/8177_1 /TAXON_ID=202472 /ORGANISM="Aulacoseira subarctica , Strain CCAP 1002/5" /LENGTH=180 /DNA_ID=CAMNT_0013162605 /DNA_START=98 /DNA_END=640 /DNA_ORIENTATION=-